MNTVPESSAWPQSHRMGAVAAWWGYSSRSAAMWWYRRAHVYEAIARDHPAVVVFLGEPEKKSKKSRRVNEPCVLTALGNLLTREGGEVFSWSYTPRIAALSKELGLNRGSLAERLRIDEELRERLAAHHPLLARFISKSDETVTVPEEYEAAIAEFLARKPRPVSEVLQTSEVAVRADAASDATVVTEVAPRVPEALEKFIEAARDLIAEHADAYGYLADFLLAVGKKMKLPRPSYGYRMYESPDNRALLRHVAPDVARYIQGLRPRRGHTTIASACDTAVSATTSDRVGRVETDAHVPQSVSSAAPSNLTIMRATGGMPTLADIAKATDGLLESQPDLWNTRGGRSYDERLALVAGRFENRTAVLAEMLGDPMTLQKLGERSSVAADFIGYPEGPYDRYPCKLSWREVYERALSLQRFLDPLAPYYRKMQHVGHGIHPFPAAFASDFYRTNFHAFATTPVRGILGIPPLSIPLQLGAQGMLRRM